MNSRIQHLFDQHPKRVLNVYFTAGYPHLDSTIEIIKQLDASGVDLIEIGMPYSDPLADGPIIQESSSKALSNGMSIELLFKQLSALRSFTSIPVVLMGYMNPVLQFGFDRFCQEASKCGIDGLILPDMPVIEFQRTYSSVLKKNHLNMVFLVTPETPEERVRLLDRCSSGFLYAVSSSSTTGKDKDFSRVEQYLSKLKSYNLSNPILVGFGIHNADTFNAVTQLADGAIIGSAFISILTDKGVDPATINDFVKSIKGN